MVEEIAIARQESGKSLAPRRRQERVASRLFLAATFIPLFLFIIILGLLTYRTLPILNQKPILDMLFGQVWLPSKGLFGFLPFILGSVWVTIGAMILAVPVSILTAIYLAEYASRRLREIFKPLIDILAGIPSVVYGLWGVLVIVPWVQARVMPFIEENLGSITFFTSKNPTGYNILSASLVLAVMVVPFIIAVAYEVIRSNPVGIREASYAVGATRWQTVRFVLIPRSISGLFAGIVLGTSRAFGETLAVLMVVGNVPKIPHSLFDAAYPLPALIANNYGEMMSIPLYDAALLGAALLLLIIVLIFNIGSTLVLRKVLSRSSA